MEATPLRFGEYRLHPTEGLSRSGHYVRVTPKSLMLLWELARHSPQVVTKDELFSAVWPDVIVTDATLSSCVSELRRALHDDARHPEFLETVHRVGFRFLRHCQPDSGGPPPNSSTPLIPPAGHEHEWRQLLDIRDQVMRGPGKFVFMEDSSGTSANSLGRCLLSDTERLASWQCTAVAAGRIPVPGGAYQLLVELIRGLSLQQAGIQSVTDLRRLAPTWLAELPELVGPEDLVALRARTAGATNARLHRELTDFLDAVCQRRPLLVLLEQLQWADEYTLDWLLSVTQDLAMPLFLVAVANTKAELVSSGQLGRLRQQIARAPDAWHLVLGSDADELGEDLGTEASPAPTGSEAGLRCQDLNDQERDVLACIHCVGQPCDTDLVANALSLAVPDAQAALENLLSAGFLSRGLPVNAATAPGGGSVYLSCNVEASAAEWERLAVSQRTKIHHRLARCLEAATDGGVHELAPLVALHYSRAHNPLQALQWHLNAAALNARRCGHRLALAHLTLSGTQLNALAEYERSEWAAVLDLAMARVNTGLEGVGSPQAEQCYRQVHRLQSGLESVEQRFASLWEIWVYYLNSAPLAEAVAVVDELEVLAKRLDSADALMHVHHASWVLAFMLGDLTRVQRHARQGIALCSDGACEGIAMTRGCTPADAHAVNHHAGVCAGFFLAWVDGLMGRREDARTGLDAGVSHARDVGHPYSLDLTLVMSAAASCAAGDPVNAHRYAEEANSLSCQHGFAILQGWSRIYRGWAEAKLGDVQAGLSLMHDGLSVCEKSPLWLFRPFQNSLHAEVLLDNGLFEEASCSLQEAFEIAERTGDRVAWVELHRLRGELTLVTNASMDFRRRAEKDLVTALEFAMFQGANLLVERAHASLNRLRGLGNYGDSAPISRT